MPKEHFGYVSDRVWNLMWFADHCQASLLETTITDLILLDLHAINAIFQGSALFRSMQFAVVEKTSQGDEPKQGTDWEWWIGHRSLGWTRYAAQAKRLFHQKGKPPHYRRVLRRVGKKRLPRQWKGQVVWQHQLLEKHAEKHDAVPLYALYNYVRKRNYGRYWHCKSGLDESKLGITVAPLKCVEHVFTQCDFPKKHKGEVDFDAIHRFRKTVPLTIPFRCLACLYARGQSEFRTIFPKRGEKGFHANYPEEIFGPQEDVPMRETVWEPEKVQERKKVRERTNTRKRRNVRKKPLKNTVVINSANLPPEFYPGEPTDAPDIILKAEIDLQGRD